MKIILKKRTAGQIEFGIIFGAVSLLVLAIARMTPLLAFAPSCLFKAITGIPCPTCGSTRSIVHLAHGNISAAIIMNPLTALCLIGAVLIFFYSLLTLVFHLPRINMILTTREGNTVLTIVIILILVQWVYLMITIR